MMDDLVQVFRKQKLAVYNCLREKIMPTVQSEITENPKCHSSDPHSGREQCLTSFIKRRDTVVSAIRANYKTRVNSLTIDQFTMVLFQHKTASISAYFLSYKYCHALIMLGALGISISHIHLDHSSIAWHLFLDHWMAVIGSLEALCGVFTVTYFYHHCHTKAMRDSYRISEGLHIRLLIYAFINSATITFVCASSVIFWSFIYGSRSGTSFSIEHIILPALLLLKMNIENIPFTMDRFMYPILLLLIYFIDVIVQYYVDYRDLFQSGEPKTYIFIYFNEKSLLNFMWFMLECLLITVAVHILLTLLWHSRWLSVHLCCPGRDRRLRQMEGDCYVTPDDTSYVFREDFVEAIPDLGKTACQRCLERIADLERSYRHDFIQPEWKQKLRNRPSLMYVLYRTGHLTVHFLMLFISLFEPEKPLTKRSVKYFVLWAFYFGNFFMCVSFIQALCGFAVIVMAYTRKTSLKYYQKSELFVTGFQKGYAVINGSAVALAIFAFVSSWVLIDDTMHKFASHDYTYDVPHLVNPLSMCLDFIIVGHPYKFIYFLLSFGILTMNIVFNYWLFHSKITGRSRAKLIYEYLKWDETLKVTIHLLILCSMLIIIHLALWVTFLTKRTINVGFRRRRLYRPREQTFRADSTYDTTMGRNGRHKSPPLAYDLSPPQSTLKNPGNQDKIASTTKSNPFSSAASSKTNFTTTK